MAVTGTDLLLIERAGVTYKATAADVAALGGGGGGGGNTLSILNFHADAGANCTLSNQATGEQYLANSARNEAYFDATNCTEVRVCARVVTASVSINNPRIYAQFRTGSAWTTIGSGLLADAIALASVGAKKTDWFALPTEARADTLYRLVQAGGDGAADPALGSVMLQFR